MTGRNTVPYRFLWGFGIVIVVAAAVVLGWFYGRTHRLTSQDHSKNGSSVRSFRVAGSSMVPTLYGPTLQLTCFQCGQEILLDAQSLSRQLGDLVCSLCGERHDMHDQRFLQSLTKRAGDVVNVTPVPTAKDYRVGDLIAVEHEGKTHVKRIAALGGDVVDVIDARLFVNDRRLEDLLATPATVVVDDDRRRTESRWLPQANGSGWRRDEQRLWRAEADAWLVYQHRNVHDHDQPSGVLDDYQYNGGVARQLRSVDRLVVSGKFTGDLLVTIEVAFWSANANVLAGRTIRGDGEFRVSFADANPAEGLPVTKQHPIAIRIVGKHALLDQLVVRRFVEYRVNQKHSLDRYPLSLSKGHVFVVGDNVPFSVDSRDWGVVPTARILGKVHIAESIGIPKQ